MLLVVINVENAVSDNSITRKANASAQQKKKKRREG